MQIMASYYITKNLSSIREHWEKFGLLRKNGIVETTMVTDKVMEKGGRITIIDWDNKIETTEVDFKRPVGFDFDCQNFYIASTGENKIYITDLNFKVERVIECKYFSDLHSLNRTKNGILVASSGIDALLEFDFEQKLIWSWFATENGYELDMLGKKTKVDMDLDHAKLDHPTLMQTTHINSAIYKDDEERKVLATLFHQGEVIEIDKNTCEIKTLLRGLKQPHSVYKDGNSFLVSDTNNGQVILFNAAGEILKTIKGDFNWIQDAIALRNGNYLIADANNHQLVEVDINSKIVSTFKYSLEYKIYNIREVTEQQMC